MDKGYEEEMDTLAGLDFWEGYEFWSAQLEAQIDEWDCLRSADFMPVDFKPSEGGDVLPF